MTSEQQRLLDELSATYERIDPRKQAVVYHTGRMTKENTVGEEQRFDPDTELPLIDIIPKGNVKERQYFGWQQYKPTTQPKGVKPAASKRSTAKKATSKKTK